MLDLFNACCRVGAGKRHNLDTMLKQPSATEELRKRLKEIEQQQQQILIVVQQCLQALEKETEEATTKPTTTTKVISKNNVVYYKHKLCIHKQRRDKCKHCGGVGLCQHFRVRSECKDCHGSGICIHNRRRTRCKECKQAQISVEQSKESAKSAAGHDDSMPVDLEEIEPDCMKSKHSDV